MRKIIGKCLPWGMALILCLLVAGCSAYANGTKVKTVRVDAGDVLSYLSTTGTVMPTHMKQYFGQGHVEWVSVSVGDQVVKDQELVVYQGGLKLTADFAGTVTAVNVAANDTDTSMQPAVVVADLNDLKVAVKVGKNSAGLVKEGQLVRMQHKGETIESVVSFVSPAAVISQSLTGESAAVIVEYLLGNQSPKFIAGFDVDADILVGSVSGAVRVPGDAIRFSKEDAYVFVVRDNIAHRVKVQVGLESEDMAEILSGLSVGDVVVTNPGDKLTEGSKLSIDEDVKGNGQ